MTQAAAARPDTPRSAYQVLERRATGATLFVLLGLSGLAWWATTQRAHDMNGMVQGLAQVGAAMPYDMSAGVFLAMWVTMMVAMMFPSVAPIVLLHRMVIRRRGGGVAPTAVFVAGYLLVWTAIGVVPLALLVSFRHLPNATGWAPRTSGAVLVVAGLYQFTRWKQTCQRACRSPLTFLATHDFGRRWHGTLRAGTSHGAYCLGCCWALMAVLFTVGLMNLVWMAVIAGVFVLEKNSRHVAALTSVVGTAVTALGVAILIHPAVLTSITSSGSAMTMS